MGGVRGICFVTQSGSGVWNAVRHFTCAMALSFPRHAMRSAVRGAKPTPAFPTNPSIHIAAIPNRAYVTTAKYTRDDAVARLDAFQSEVMSANWADYLYLV